MRTRIFFSAVLLLTGCDSRPDDLAGRKGPGEITTEGRDEVQSYLAAQIRAGYINLDEAVETTVEVFADEYDPDILKPIAREIGREILDQIIQEAASWPGVTDCDRLDAAFKELLSSGIVARQNFSCCGTCGAAEIGDEMKAEAERGMKVRGYTFFHVQDTESAVDGYGLYLAYGSVKEGEEAALGIGEEIIKTLRKHKLTTEWDGTWEKRIGIQLSWKRRGPWFGAEHGDAGNRPSADR